VPTVREATFDVWRTYGLTTMFANPGSTEIELLTDLPDDLRFVLGLHESTVVGMAIGWALGRREPALAILHTTPGLGNAVSAIATARVNRAPVVIVVGQQDRRHLATEPFLAGRLLGLAGDYPVWVDQPVRAQDVPGAITRACHEAVTASGPAIVIVPMDDWSAEATEPNERAAPVAVARSHGADPEVMSQLVALLGRSSRPVLVAGAGTGEPAGWTALVALAEQLGCPVWQEPFSGRAGFPGDHPRFAGHLSAERTRVRAALAQHDLVIAVGAPVFRQYPYVAGPFVEPGTTVAMISRDPEEVHRSTADLAVLGDPAAICTALVAALDPREGGDLPAPSRPERLDPPRGDAPLRAAHVFDALAERLPSDAVVIEESPSSRPDLLARMPARAPLGALSPAMGQLGFALPAATGLSLGCPDRPVVAVMGDGASLYSVQGLWTAAHYGAGPLIVVLANGGYAIMDRLAEQQGGGGPWPGFGIDIAGLARSFGCSARSLATHAELVEALDDAVPRLGATSEPLLLEVAIEPEPTFAS
jgi:benzoylformate decarboxylase